MDLKAIAGGFQLTGEDRQLLNVQRAITHDINNKFVQVGAIFLKTSNKNPFDEDGWMKVRHRDTNLQTWIDDPDLIHHNVGFNLQQGWMDVDIDASDPEYNRCILAAMDSLKIDTRFQFGRASVGVASHVLLQLGEGESDNFDVLSRFEPRPFTYKDKRYHVQLRSQPTNVKAENVVRSAKQTVMPGSIYTHKTKNDAYDISVWYAPNGKVATDVRQIAATTPRRVNFNEVVRAITFGTFLYFLRDKYIEGERHSTIRVVAGWLARIVAESQALNNHEAVAHEVYCPVDDHSVAEALISFLADWSNDSEKHMRIRAYHDAVDKLDRNPDARIPGWPAMEALLGGEAVMALRTVFMPGSDVSVLTKMAERYIYDESDDSYIDRDRFHTSANYVHAAHELERRHKGDTVRIGNKAKEAFRLFESSDIRKRVGIRNLYPDLAPGSIYRITALDEVLSDDQDDPTALSVFNTWRGWPVRPTDDVDEELMADIVGRLDQVLKYLTRDNIKQVEWIKKWFAYTIKRPGDKQQIAWVVVGGQGVGKSWIGNIFANRLFGNMWGSASPKVLESDFVVSPFIDKMFVFIDEAKFHSEAATDEIKKMIRSVDVPGAEKFENAKNHKIYARVMFASNRFDMNIGQANVRDRALFYTRAYDRDHLNMSEMEFRAWTETLKPFFDEFTALINQRKVREHFMRYFMDMDVSRHELESIQHSSSGDEAILASNMSWARRVAKHIIEEGRIHEDLDISYPFTLQDLFRKVGDVCKELGFRGVQGARVLAEYEEAGVIEKVVIGGQRKLRFRYKIGTLHEKYGHAISVPLDARYVFDEDDHGVNDNDGMTRVAWKGGKVTKF